MKLGKRSEPHTSESSDCDARVCLIPCMVAMVISSSRGSPASHAHPSREKKKWKGLVTGFFYIIVYS